MKPGKHWGFIFFILCTEESWKSWFIKLAFVCCTRVKLSNPCICVWCCSQAVSGQAIDRHLLGLKLAAIESRMNLHELFMDSSYQYALHYKLSTSQVRATCMFLPWTGWAEDYSNLKGTTPQIENVKKKIEEKIGLITCPCKTYLRHSHYNLLNNSDNYGLSFLAFKPTC